MDKELEAAVQFFKNERAYGKLFQLFRKKYESLGRIGGTVSTQPFSHDELDEIGRFFGLPGEQLQLKGRIGLLHFEEQLSFTRFSSIALKELLDAYFGEVIISKKEQQLANEEKLRTFFTTQYEHFPHIAFWLQFIYEQRTEGRWMIRMAETNEALFITYAQTLHRAFQSLPKKVERLPMFSQRMTGDPHAFDLNRDLGRMFIHLLAVHRFEQGMTDEIEFATTTEEINELLESYQIYRDDLLNFVTCANLIAETANGIHPVWEAAATENSVQIVPLRELITIEKVQPASGNIVWIVENSGVCSTLLDQVPTAPIVCTNGQFTLASLLLMDLLVESGCIIYYSGDFDPEGLGMAQRLVERYREAIELWHMDLESYRQTNPIKELTQERLEKLHHIHDERLIEVAEEMRKIGKAGYQEALVDFMLEDVMEVSN